MELAGVFRHGRDEVSVSLQMWGDFFVLLDSFINFIHFFFSRLILKIADFIAIVGAFFSLE